MHIDFFLNVFKKNLQRDAIVWNGKAFSYDWLLKKYYSWTENIDKNHINEGAVVIIEADFSPSGMMMLSAGNR